jgi:hypothetical protein
MDATMPDPKKLEAAQRAVALAMGACMALSWAPFVGGVLSGIAQVKLVGSVLRIFERPHDDDLVETLIWFFSKKTLYLNVATYAPTIGPAVQVVLTYALGQLVIRCASDEAFGAMNEEGLELRWRQIQEDIFAGENIIASYEQFSGKTFPKPLKPKIVVALDWMSAAYRKAESLPGVAKSQDALGGALQRGGRAVARGLARLRRKKDSVRR